VGGCCRTSAKDIQKIKMKIDSLKKNWDFILFFC
jgi:hypothetical protein